MSSVYYAGVDKVEITPPLTVPYLGFTPRHSLFKDVHDRLYARCLYVFDGERKAMIVSINSIGFSWDVLGKDRDFYKEIKNKITGCTGIDEDSIMIASSHIHSTPDTLNFRPLIESEGAIEWLEELIDKIARCAARACDNTFAAVLKTGAGVVGGISRNRRRENDLDTEMRVLLFEEKEGSRRIAVVNYALHPVILQVQDKISADYVGVLENSVESILEGVEGCLMLQGACGDIDPRLGDTRAFDDVKNTGMAMAAEAIKIISLMLFKDYSIQPADLRTISRAIMLKSRPMPEPSETERIVKAVADHTASRGDEEAYYRIIEGSGSFPAYIQLIKLGNCYITGIPAEPFCSMGIKIKKMLKNDAAIIAGYANGYLGYIGPQACWENKGYEFGFGPWSKIGPEGYDNVLDTVAELITQIRQLD